jgi:hypothetical protein
MAFDTTGDMGTNSTLIDLPEAFDIFSNIFGDPGIRRYSAIDKPRNIVSANQRLRSRLIGGETLAVTM